MTSLEKLFTSESKTNYFDKQIIDIDKLIEKYDIHTIEDDIKLMINNNIFNTADYHVTFDEISQDNYNKILTYCNLMKTIDSPLNIILIDIINKILGIEKDDIYKSYMIAKIYFLLNNIEILFLYDTFDYKLIARILNRDNFINDVNYKKACFIAMVVFEMWSLTAYQGNELDSSNVSFYKQLINSTDATGDYADTKRYKIIHDLIHEIKDDARAFVNSPDFDYALKHNTFEIEIPKRNLDNVIRPLRNIKQPDNQKVFSFNLPSPNNPQFNGSILPSSIRGGVRLIKGGDEEKLKMLKESYEHAFPNENDIEINQTRFLFDCLITSNAKGADKCMNTLSVSTAKIESYKIVETLPRATLVKLATVLGIQFPNDKIETYSDWIKRIKDDELITDEKTLLDENGEVKMNVTLSDDNRNAYKKLILIHYIGQVIIDKLTDRNVEYDILRAQNKAKVQFTKISGPEVSYRTRSNYTNFRSNPHSLSLSSNPIFMNMNLYSKQSSEQLDRIKNGLISGGASVPDAQLYSSNIYEKAITQALHKYKGMGYKINPNALKVIDETIEGLKNTEIRILDTYSQLMNVLQFSTLINNPSYMASLSEEEKKNVEDAWKNRDPKKLLELKNKLDKELKEKQTLAYNAKTILDFIFPWKKSLEETINNNFTSLNNNFTSLNKKIDTLPKLDTATIIDSIISKINNNSSENIIYNTFKKLVKDIPFDNSINKQLFCVLLASRIIKFSEFKHKFTRDRAILMANDLQLRDNTNPTKDEFIQYLSTEQY